MATAATGNHQTLVLQMAADLRAADASETEQAAFRALLRTRKYQHGDIVTLIDAAREIAASGVLDAAAAKPEPQP